MEAIDPRARQLADYIKAEADFTFIERQAAHQHMGATIAEAILQAGMRYRAQVVPRVRRIRHDYPEATTSSAFLAILDRNTPEQVINIHGRKAGYVRALTDLLVGEQVETEADLRTWLDDADHVALLLAITGVGNKTVSYLRLLLGCPDDVAVDTHLRAFLAAAGVTTAGYADAAAVVAGAAEILGVTQATLDVSIWAYQGR
jgi:3-methyladenine DNA glycosylase/8-oxoguanine DNA glycosylase